MEFEDRFKYILVYRSLDILLVGILIHICCSVGLPQEQERIRTKVGERIAISFSKTRRNVRVRNEIEECRVRA
jgi:hypothetical protein